MMGMFNPTPFPHFIYVMSGLFVQSALDAIINRLNKLAPVLASWPLTERAQLWPKTITSCR